MGIIIMLIGGGISLLPIIGIVILIVILVRKSGSKDEKQQNKGQQFTFQNLLKVYLYIIVTLSLFVGLIGFTFVGRASLSLIDNNLSYDLETAGLKDSAIYYDYEYDTKYQYPSEPDLITDPVYYCYEASDELVKVGDDYYCHDPLSSRLDLINGLTIALSTSFIFILHVLLLIKLEKENPSHLMRKSFIFGNLMIYSLLGVISLPISIYSTFNYFLIEDLVASYGAAPGGIISFTVFTIIIWITWLVIMLKNKDEKQAN